jgi:endonuclease-3
MADNRPLRILETLRRTFSMSERTTSSGNPFRTLIVTIISQNTAGRNTARAFENLSKHFEIAPEALANAETSQIEECLKVAGLYKNKAKAIKEVSRIIHERYRDDMKAILLLPLEEARDALLQLPGVGPKTADVVLLFSADKPTIPVDTHVNRVAKRLGLVPAVGNYEAVRESLQSRYDPEDYLAVHALLISHGKRYCRARNPLCMQCPINTLCPTKQICGKDD